MRSWLLNIAGAALSIHYTVTDNGYSFIAAIVCLNGSMIIQEIKERGGGQIVKK